MGSTKQSELRLLLVDGKFDEFNELAALDPPDLEDVSLRGIDLRKADLSHANLRGAYLRLADLRGVNLFHADLDGASIHDARIGGAYFPANVAADEIQLSQLHGPRLRTRRD